MHDRHRTGNGNFLSSMPKADLHEEVTARLAELVATSQPGTRLSTERELGERLNIGRSTVREALLALQFISAIDIIQGHGIIVSSNQSAESVRLLSLGLVFQRPSVQEVVDARHVLKVEIAGLAATNRD